MAEVHSVTPCVYDIVYLPGDDTCRAQPILHVDSPACRDDALLVAKNIASLGWAVLVEDRRTGTCIYDNWPRRAPPPSIRQARRLR